MDSANQCDRLRLRVDIPELGLCRGQIGVLRSTWLWPAVAYEVEFEPAQGTCKTRALLLQNQVEAADAFQSDLLNRGQTTSR